MLATMCDYCGNQSCSDVKSIGGMEKMEAKGTRISLNVKGINDVNRDLLKVIKWQPIILIYRFNTETLQVNNVC